MLNAQFSRKKKRFNWQKGATMFRRNILLVAIRIRDGKQRAVGTLCGLREEGERLWSRDTMT